MLNSHAQTPYQLTYARRDIIMTLPVHFILQSSRCILNRFIRAYPNGEEIQRRAFAWWKSVQQHE
jgi:hypothetical protein